MRRKSVSRLLLLVVLALTLGVATVAMAHTETVHHHSWSGHSVVADGLLVGHNSYITCTNGPLNLDNKKEIHDHYEKKNSGDYWRFAGHSRIALNYTALGLC
jgi:hypothetical protein